MFTPDLSLCPAPISEMSQDSAHCARCGCLTANWIIVPSHKTSETNVDNSDAGCQSGLKRLASSQNLLTGDDVGVKGLKRYQNLLTGGDATDEKSTKSGGTGDVNKQQWQQ